MPGDPIDEEFGVPVDDAFGVEARPRRRRVVLDETEIVGTPEGTGYERVGVGGHVEEDDREVDTSAPFKAEPTGPTPEQRTEWTRRDAAVSPLWRDALVAGAALPGEERGMSPQARQERDAAQERMAVRASDFWRDTQEDPAGTAAGIPVAAAEGVMAGTFPEAVAIGETPEVMFDPLGLVSDAPERFGERTEAARSDMARLREVNPNAFDVAETGGAVAGALGGPVASAGRGASLGAGMRAGAATGAAYGALGGIGAADPTSLPDAAFAGAEGAVPGAIIGAGAGAIPDLAGRAGRRLRTSAARTQDFADQARLEASGFWGRRAQDAVDSAGGPSRVAGDLRRWDVAPRSEQAASDLADLRRGGGDAMGLIATTADEAGARIQSRAITNEAERIARELEGEGLQTSIDAARRIRAEVAPLAGRPEMTVTQAHRLRRRLDELATFGRGPGADMPARASGEQFAALRRTLDREMDSALGSVGLGRQWDEASRMSQMGIISDEVGAGHRRLSTTGGIGGATATGDIVADAMRSGSLGQMVTAVPRAIASRAVTQETRMLAPGVVARVSEGTAGAQRSIADRLLELAMSRPSDVGRYAQQIIESAQRGLPALLATIHVAAQQDPQMRRALEAEQE